MEISQEKEGTKVKVVMGASIENEKDIDHLEAHKIERSIDTNVTEIDVTKDSNLY